MNIKSHVSQRHFYKEYNRLSGADAYLVAFPAKDNVYLVKFEHIPYRWCSMYRESTKRGGYQKMMMHAPLKELNQMEKEILCSIAEFEKINSEMKNRGRVVEKILRERNGEEFYWDNVPFDQDGDVTIDGIAYQIKWYQASFCNIKTLHNAQARAREMKKILASA